MHKIFLGICLLTVFVITSCRPADTVMPNTPMPSTNSAPPLPTLVVPRTVPGATPAASPSPMSVPAASGVHLTATIGPTCPGPERPGQVCTQPYEGLFLVTDNTDAEVARVTTDQNGQATIDLPPGNYVITPKVEGLWPSGAPTPVTVLDGQYVEVSIELDSGMR